MYSKPVELDVFRKLLTGILNSAKSSNPVVRASATTAFQSLCQKTSRDEDLSAAATELLALPKTGKTTGPEHRVVLYTMLGSLTPSTCISSAIIKAGLPLLAKESNDAAIGALSFALVPHLEFCLRNGVPLASEDQSLVVREMTNTKPAIRKAFCILAGEALWVVGEAESAETVAFAQALLPAFDANLKNVAANPMGAASGPLEGYISLAIMLGPLSRNAQSNKFGEIHKTTFRYVLFLTCTRGLGF